ncbi:hypothetical protein H1A91_000428 [Campylobacter jejuni]|nr:hypothetical protein [Campylobacter jejuni]
MKAYHTKEQVIIKLSKDEYRKEMKLNKYLKDENKSLKTEISVGGKIKFPFGKIKLP